MNFSALAPLMTTSLSPIAHETGPSRLGDDHLFSRLPGGGRCASDLLTSPSARAYQLSSRTPPDSVLAGATALWVHTGRGHTDSIEVTAAHSRPRRVAARWYRLRSPMPHIDLSSVPVLSLESTAAMCAATMPRHSVRHYLLILGLAGTDLHEAEQLLELLPRDLDFLSTASRSLRETSDLLAVSGSD